MPTQDYRDAAGKRLPGVTTVIGQNLGWNKDVLVRWANREGLEGRNVRERTDKAAEIGDAVHAAIEATILGRNVTVPEVADDLKSWVAEGYGSYERWARQTRGEIVATELWGVDEEYRVGFCPDALRLEDDGLALVDWKTSRGTYADHFIQISAYAALVERQLSRWGRPVRLTGAHLCRFDKTSGAFSHHFWPRDLLDLGWSAFTWLRSLHEVRWTIEGYTR